VVPAPGPVIGGPGHAETYPSGLETTADGGVVLADTGQDRVERYEADGDLQWTYGTHGTGPNRLTTPRDIGIDAAGNIYVADTGNNSVVKLRPDGTYVARFTGPATDKIKSPIGLTVANGKLLVADAGVPAIRVLNLDGVQQQKITSPAGCPFAPIRDVTQDPAGNFYVANYTRNNVLKLRPDGSCLASFGVKGTAVGQWKNPYGVAVARDPHLGNLLYVADSNNNRIQVLRLNGQPVASFGTHGGFGIDGTFDELRRVAVAPDGDVWGADIWGFTAKRWDRTTTGWGYAQTIGSRAPGTTASALFNQPNGMDFDRSGNLLVADRMHHRFATFTPGGVLVRLCGFRASGSLGFNWPRDMAVDPVTGEIWLADTHQNRLHVVAPDCSRSTPLGTAGTAPDQMKFPSGIDIRASDRTAFVVDSNNNRLVSWDVANRRPIAVSPASLGLKRPRGIYVDPATGHLLVADRGANRVLRIASDGRTFTVRATYPGFNKPEGVTVDDTGRIYVADTRNDRVVVLNSTGVQIGVLTGFDDPVDVEWNGGVLYVADTYADRVRTYRW
jgi:DNA-binding beta-propeller fold protein YncE